MKTRALGKLKGKNPAQPAARAPPAMANGQGSSQAAPRPTRIACVAASPLMPSMKFQMLTKDTASTKQNTAFTTLPVPTQTSVPSNRAANRCTHRRGSAGKERWSSHQPIPATSSRPTANTSNVTACAGIHIAPSPQASSCDTTMPMPPPRGVDTAWLRRSPGWSMSCRHRA